MDEFIVKNRSCLNDILGSEGLLEWKWTLVDLGLKSFTYILRRNEKRPPEKVIQVPRQGAEYQMGKKELLYQLVARHTEVPVPAVRKRQHRHVPYLVMDYCAGFTFGQRELNADRSAVFYQLGRYLAQIHESVHEFQEFGWLGEHGVVGGGHSFIQYLESESRRIYKAVATYGSAQELDLVTRHALPRLMKELHQDFKPVLVWYDLHPDNIVLEQNPAGTFISGWLDPGSARVGPYFWDLAHAKQHLCGSPEDWAAFIEGYSNNCENFLDVAIIQLFQLLVLLDDLAIGLEENLHQISTRSFSELERLFAQ